MVLGSLVVQAQNNAIFNGGAGDGWDKNAYQQPANTIYAGGNGDGWNFNSFTQAGNSIFGGGGGDGWASVYRPLGPLPVTWLSFSATRQGATAMLKWQTAIEQNTAFFDVERSGATGNFEHIATVRAGGNSTSPLSYSFTDATPLKTANFYRIKQVDNDGRFTYTPVRLLNFDEATSGSLLVYPVPARTRLIVSLPVQLEGLTTVTIHSADGRLVQQQQVPVQVGVQLIDLNISALPNGIYHVKAATSHKKVSATFVKQ